MTEITKNIMVNFTFIGKNITLEATVENNDMTVKISGAEFNSLDGVMTLNQENINDLKDFIGYVEEKRYNV
jgi:cystathionine beta-lyase family protein involved in aluminum resistance